MKYDIGRLIQKYSGMFGATLVNIFFIGSLYTFSPYDQSWFYHTTSVQPYHNCFGVAGSYTGALGFYLFGLAVWCIPMIFQYGILLYKTIMLDKKRYFAHEWDRIVGVLMGYSALLVLFQIYNVVHYDFTYAGGVVGHYMFQSISYYFDPLVLTIIMWTIACIAFFLMTQGSYFIVLSWIYRIICYTMRSENMPARIVRSLLYMVIYSLQIIYYGLHRAYTVLSGTFIDHLNRSIVEFEYEKPVDQDIDAIIYDIFWNDYVEQKRQDHVKQQLEQDKDDDHLQAAMVEKNIEFQMHKEHDFDAHNSYQLQATDGHTPELVSSKSKSLSEKKSYTLPSLPVKKIEKNRLLAQQEALTLQAQLLEEKLAQFDIQGTVVAMHAGPVVVLFEYQPDIKVKVSRILALEDDLAMALKALSIRIIAPIPGRSVVGFEVANKERQDVLFSNILQSIDFKQHTGSLPMIFGQDTLGNNVIADLAKMPHLLIAGSTGSGKSVALNAMLVSLLCSLKPEQLKLIIIDPKRLEFAAYDGIAHLLFPIVTETKKAIPVLKWVVQTMEDRYKTMASYGVRNLLDYQTAAKTNLEMPDMPLIVVIIDELADLMMTAGKAVEDSIARLAQMARAAGIHMIIATQRPSVDVITGMIKVNFPNRVAFKVTSKIDSRTILDAAGAEKLLGRGDMLFLDASKSNLIRVHGAYVSDAEIHKVVEQIRSQQPAQYLDLFEQYVGGDEDELLDGDDELYQEVLTLLQDLDEVSISMLQRRFRIGYNRSARIISILESKGLIMPMEGGKTRRVVKP